MITLFGWWPSLDLNFCVEQVVEVRYADEHNMRLVKIATNQMTSSYTADQVLLILSSLRISKVESHFVENPNTNLETVHSEWGDLIISSIWNGW